MKRLVYIMFIYELVSEPQLHGKEIPTILVRPGETTTFTLEDADAHELAIHAQNKWRYVNDFSCTQEGSKAQCSLSVNKEEHIPTTFSIFQKENDNDSEVKAFVTITKEVV